MAGEITPEPRYRSSMADLAEVGVELFERLKSIATDLQPGGWEQQPQHVHDAVCIFFAMVRNRTSAFDVNAKLAAELKNLL